jgi:predicted Zn-dependent peptidase
MCKVKLPLTLFLGLSLNLFLGASNFQQTKSIFPPLQREILKNGLPIIYQHDSSSPLTVLLLIIKGGRRVEPEGKSGLGYLTTRLALEIPDQSKVRQLMTQASQLTFSTFPDYNLIRLASLSPHFVDTLKLMSSIMVKPLFSGIRIKRIKKNMLRSKKRIQDKAQNLARQKAQVLLFGSSGYGASSYGSEKSLDNINKKDIENYYKTYFTAANMLAVVISDKDLASLIPQLEEHMGKFPAGTPASYSTLTFPTLEKEEKKVDRESKEFLLYLAYRLPPLNQKTCALSLLLNHLLGKGVSSRLWKLREYEKLAYNIQSEVHLYQEGGLLEVVLETSPEKREAAWKALEREMNLLITHPVDESEWSMTKAYTKASLLRQCQEKNTRATYLATFETTGLGAEFLEDIFDYIDQLTLNDFDQYIQEILSPTNRIVIKIGPQSSTN